MYIYYTKYKYSPDKFTILKFSVGTVHSPAGLPDGRHHGHFPEKWPFYIFFGRGKFVALSGRKVAMRGLNVAVKIFFPRI